MKFELATEADRQDLLKLYHSVLGTDGTVWTLEYPNDDTITFDLSRNALYVLRTEEGTLAGAISIDEDPEVESLTCWTRELLPGRELSRLGVAPAYQNRGIARQLITYAMEVLKAQGYGSVHFLVCKTNERALRSYDKLSFQRVGESNAHGHAHWCYEKAL